jgi:hypothetical protein
MNKEEKIEYFQKKIKSYNAILEDMLTYNDKESFRENCIKRTKNDVQAFETMVKLLSIPQRAIETLEVGDYVHIKWDTYEEEFEEVKGFVEEVDDEFVYINDFEYDKLSDVEIIQIMPHQVLDLLKGVNGVFELPKKEKS